MTKRTTPTPINNKINLHKRKYYSNLTEKDLKLWRRKMYQKQEKIYPRSTIGYIFKIKTRSNTRNTNLFITTSNDDETLKKY